MKWVLILMMGMMMGAVDVPPAPQGSSAVKSVYNDVKDSTATAPCSLKVLVTNRLTLRSNRFNHCRRFSHPQSGLPDIFARNFAARSAPTLLVIAATMSPARIGGFAGLATRTKGVTPAGSVPLVPNFPSGQTCSATWS